jgi:hypothetical protein
VRNGSDSLKRVTTNDADAGSSEALPDGEREAAQAALEAIEELSRVNRDQSDLDRERRLVELRHLAYGAVPATPGRTAWPPDLADPFPGERGLPEVSADQVSAAVIGGGILHHGCVRVNGLMAPEDAARFRDYIDQSFDERENAATGEGNDEAPRSYVPFELGREKAEGFGRAGFIRAVDVPHALFDLVEVFTDSGVRAAITDYFRERPVMIANKWVLRKTATGKIGKDFHQDGAFLGDGIRTMDCWIALSHCGPGTGKPAVDLIPRRFPILASGEGAAFSWSLSEESVVAAAPDAEIVSPVFAPGDALFFDERLPHRTSVGLDLTTRYAIESWFVAKSSYPSKHVPIVL